MKRAQLFARALKGFITPIKHGSYICMQQPVKVVLTLDGNKREGFQCTCAALIKRSRFCHFIFFDGQNEASKAQLTNNDLAHLLCEISESGNFVVEHKQVPRITGDQCLSSAWNQNSMLSSI